MCSSDCVSSEWIASLFNRKTVNITPLDIRLSISSQFRLLFAMCNISELLVEQIRDEIIVDKLVSTQVFSIDSFNVRIDALVNYKFDATFNMYIRPNQSFKMIVSVLSQLGIHSAINMDAFTISIPNLNQYSTIDNFYPLNDNVRFLFFIFGEYFVLVYGK